ncbi:MAG: hypothetical protein PF505_10830 [Vallitaleaceae bacterium]|jgi:hypothetical protein|nr:hypothetical protein [Vallitaleaceae bacterium]
MNRIIVIIMILTLLIGCSTKSTDNIEGNLDSIEVSIVDTHERENDTYYKLEVINNSNFGIESIDLMMGYSVYPEVQSKGYSSNIMFNAKSNEGPYGLAANTSRIYTVHVPIAFLKEDLVNLEDVEISLVGYFDENRFQKLGGIEGFSSDSK